jgi:hypothetical protein
MGEVKPVEGVVESPPAFLYIVGREVQVPESTERVRVSQLHVLDEPISEHIIGILDGDELFFIIIVLFWHRHCCS